MEPLISPIISAAIPDFHANPAETDTPAVSPGITDGRYMYVNFFSGVRVNTFAIWSNLISVSLIAESRLVYITGNTIIAEINMESLAEVNQSRARITMEATGMHLIILTGREIIASAKGCKEATTASMTARTNPMRNPAAIPFNVVNMLKKKSGVRANSIRALKVSAGEGKNISLSIIMAAICHIKHHMNIAIIV